MTNDATTELLTRAQKLASQVERLHEISHNMARDDYVTPGEIVIAQAIMAEATALADDITSHLKAAPPLRAKHWKAGA